MKDSVDREITPELVLRGYAAGVFPMADAADSPEIYWVDPRRRGILPLDGYHMPRRLRRTIQKGRYRVRIDTDFAAVLDGCAERDETWINSTIRDLFLGIHRMGHAHSVEVWQDEALIGGLYGVRLGAAFFGESMFSRARDASKIALAHLVARLRAGGFRLLDTQFTTDHLERFGATTVTRACYHRMLEQSIREPADFHALGAVPPAVWLGLLPEPGSTVRIGDCAPEDTDGSEERSG